MTKEETGTLNSICHDLDATYNYVNRIEETCKAYGVRVFEEDITIIRDYLNSARSYATKLIRKGQ